MKIIIVDKIKTKDGNSSYNAYVFKSEPKLVVFSKTEMGALENLTEKLKAKHGVYIK